MGKRRSSTQTASSNTAVKRRRNEKQDVGLASSNFSNSKPPIDPATGQRTAFPGLDDVGEEGEDFYGPANDGFSYLRMVRSEARLVPDLLTASSGGLRRNTSVTGSCNEEGFYEDGVFTAVSNLQEDHDVQQRNDAQDAYHNSLCERFLDLRASLSQKPPQTRLQGSGSDKSIAFQALNYGTKIWRSVLREKEPSPVNVADLRIEAVLRALKLISTTLLRRRQNIAPLLSSWTWCLLAKLPEIGCLDSESVGVVRELGKRAVHLLSAIKDTNYDYTSIGDEQVEDEVDEDAFTASDFDYDIANGNDDDKREEVIEASKAAPEQNVNELLATDGREKMDESRDEFGDQMDTIDVNGGQFDVDVKRTGLREDLNSQAIEQDPENLDSDFEEGELQDSSDEAEELNDARQRLLLQFDNSFIAQESNSAIEDGIPSANTLVTLDMIITVTGEFFGQKDLLMSREAWP